MSDLKFSNLLYRVDGKGTKFRIDNFIILFYTIYLVIALFGYTFINYIQINISTLFIYFIYVLFLYFGAFIGIRLKIGPLFPRRSVKINDSFVRKFLIMFGAGDVRVFCASFAFYVSLE